MANYETLNENRTETKTSGGFLVGAIIGGLVGAATALFLAPKSGKEIRGDLSVQAETLKGKTIQLYDVAKEKGSELAVVAKEKSTTLGQAVTKQSNELIGKVKSVKPTDTTGEEEGDELVYEEDFSPVLSDDEELQRKLEETKKAFDETESQVNTL